MLEHPPQQLVLKSGKYFMKQVSHRREPEDTIIFLTAAFYARYDLRSTLNGVF